MNSQDRTPLEDTLHSLESEINLEPLAKHQPEEPAISPPWYEKVLSAYRGLSGTGKLVAAGVAVLAGYALLQLFFKLVAILLSLAVLGTLLYLGYKFFSVSQSSTPDRK